MCELVRSYLVRGMVLPYLTGASVSHLPYAVLFYLVFRPVYLPFHPNVDGGFVIG